MLPALAGSNSTNSPVCFGAKGDQFARFKKDWNMFVRSIMFVYRTEKVTRRSSFGMRSQYRQQYKNHVDGGE